AAGSTARVRTGWRWSPRSPRCRPGSGRWWSCTTSRTCPCPRSPTSWESPPAPSSPGCTVPVPPWRHSSPPPDRPRSGPRTPPDAEAPMNDPIDDLTVRTAFERLRADATATIHPPGVAAARRSVRRRRYAASAAGGLAALLLSSGAAAALWWEAPDGTGPAPVVTAASPSAAPSPSTSRADAPPDGTALAEMAWDALTGLVGDEARIFAYGGLAVPDDLDMPFPGDFELMPGMAPGRYRMTV